MQGNKWAHGDAFDDKGNQPKCACKELEIVDLSSDASRRQVASMLTNSNEIKTIEVIKRLGICWLLSCLDTIRRGVMGPSRMGIRIRWSLTSSKE